MSKRETKEITALYIRAIDFAKRRAQSLGARPEVAEEFGGWFALKILEGNGEAKSISDAFNDFLREEKPQIMREQAQDSPSQDFSSNPTIRAGLHSPRFKHRSIGA